MDNTATSQGNFGVLHRVIQFLQNYERFCPILDCDLNCITIHKLICSAKVTLHNACIHVLYMLADSCCLVFVRCQWLNMYLVKTTEVAFVGAQINSDQGVTLANCESDKVDLSEIKSAPDCIEAAANPDIVLALEDLATTWCKQIEQVSHLSILCNVCIAGLHEFLYRIPYFFS